MLVCAETVNNNACRFRPSVRRCYFVCVCVRVLSVGVRACWCAHAPVCALLCCVRVCGTHAKACVTCTPAFSCIARQLLRSTVVPQPHRTGACRLSDRCAVAARAACANHQCCCSQSGSNPAAPHAIPRQFPTSTVACRAPRFANPVLQVAGPQDCHVEVAASRRDLGRPNLP